MKRNLLIAFLSLSTIASIRADLIWYEGFNYADGYLPTVSSGVWARHSGSQNDSLVNNKKLEVSTSGVGLARTDDVNRSLCTVGGCSYTNSGTVLYASFTMNFTNLPSAAGAYFAHFHINSSTFPCRIWAWTTGTVLPNTFRVGVSAGSQGSPNKVIPVDLMTNIDYQVVVKWDPNLGSATLWVNPLSESEIGSGLTSDSVGVNVNPPAGFGIRQATGFGGFLTLSNLSVATTFDEAATNVWSPTPVAPTLLVDLKSATNFVGAPVTLSALPNGQSLADLSYTWIKDNVETANPGGNSYVFSIPSLTVGDAGQYQCVVSNLASSLSVTSSVAYVAIDPRTIAPFFAQPPKGATNFFGGTVILTAGAAGPQPISYQWTYNGGPITSGNVSGADTATLTITGIHTNNGTAGTYTCVATNDYGASTNANAYAQAIAPARVSVAFLRTLVDTVNYNATNSTTVWQVTGAVTTSTNITTGNTSSYYLQDGTAGINIFATFASTFRPAQVDIVTFIGVLSSFNSALELLADTENNPSSSYTILSNNLTFLPAPRPIAFSITNNLPFCETNLEGSIVMLTNVYFGTNAGTTINTNTSANASSIVVSNAAGQTFNIGFAAVDLEVAGQTLPPFAYTVAGPFNQNLNNTATPRNSGYQVTVTRFSDIVTNPLSVSITRTGSTNSLDWEAAPYTYSYSVLTSTNVNGPYAPEYQIYRAIMSGSNEVPGNASTAYGYGTVELSPDQTSIKVNMNFTGLTGGTASAAHIHGPAAVGVNAGVLFGFSGVPAATSGAIPEQTFAINATQLGYLKSGLLYMNVHNATFGGGEIRGQLFPVPFRFTDASGKYQDASLGTNKFYRVTTP